MPVKLSVCASWLRIAYFQPDLLLILLEQLGLLSGGFKELIGCDALAEHNFSNDEVLLSCIDVKLFVNIVHILNFLVDFLNTAEGL